MTRSFVRNMSSWLNAAFWSKVFNKKPEAYARKVKTPRSYYRAKMRQQSREQDILSPLMRREYAEAQIARKKRKR